MKIDELNLNALKYFVDTVTLGSLTSAAEKNHVSRPAISQSIRRLENSMSLNLLDHKKNSLVLTNEGKAFYQKAQRALEQFRLGFETDTSHPDELKIATSTTLAQYLIIPRLRLKNQQQNTTKNHENSNTLKNAYPKDNKAHKSSGAQNQKLNYTEYPKINIRIGTSAKVRQMISDGEARLGIIIDDEKTYGFQTQMLFKGNFNLYSKSGRLELPIITTETRPEVLQLRRILFQMKNLNHKLQASSWVEIESWSACQHFASENFGSCLLPD
ncbi:MAG: LysR family transcriptional regulator, partial [Bdellovibrionales bacterium]